MFEKNLILFLDKEYKDKKELLTDLSKAVDSKVTSSEDYEKAVKERENTIVLLSAMILQSLMQKQMP